MGDLLRDLRHALRVLLQTPGFSLAAILTLALGIGAATAIFSMVDAVLLRPLPFAGQDRLVTVWGEVRERNQAHVEVSLQDYEGWKEGNRVFSDLGLLAATDSDLALTGGDQPLHVRGRLVSANLFDVLGVRPALGRSFRPEEDRPDSQDVAVVSHGFWQRHFGGDPGVLGKSVSLDGEPHLVIGVMPAGFRFPRDVDLWIPAGPLGGAPELKTIRVFEAIGRLKPGISIEQAQTDMTALSVRLEEVHPQTNQGYRAALYPLVDEILGDTGPALLLLLAAVALVLLIACANVAGLLLARAASRQKETAVRIALGAGRPRLIRQLLTESVLLAVLAAAVGLLLAWLGLRIVTAVGPADIPRLDEVGIDGRVLAFTLLVSLVTAVLFGLAPALQAARPDLTSSLKEGGKSSASRGSRRLRSLLVVAEVALALVLLVGAGLVIRSFLHLQRTDLGFEPESLLTMRITLYGDKRPEPHQWAAFYRDVAQRAEALPGVERASVVLLRPLSGPIGWDYDFMIDGQTPDEQKTNPTSNHERVSPGYFRTMGIPLVAGRDFTWSDGAEAPKVAIVNQSMARRFWPGQDPLGKRLRFGRPGREGPWMTVVGIAGDVRYRELQSVKPDIYVPFLQDPHWAMDLVVRTASDPLSAASAVTAAVQEVDRDQPVSGITTMERALSDTVARPRLRSFILGMFAALALLLAAVGLYGIIAQSVAQRRQEIGIRIALGAGRPEVLRLVLRQGLGLTLAGLAAGLVLAVAVGATGWLATLLYGVEPMDFVTFAAVPLVLLAVAVAASLLPALRATRVDPLTVLRAE
ncbi:MAG TPA: ABC transporter permease [Thermoanaerobaculia bacterium]|nr:ABC transporter permease [Thermoanaerobaculia bacterium]